ncbi:hypothetical protein Droror1_Dr00004585 [Drosera rotundifolia]
MQYHSFIFSVICKCSYKSTEEGTKDRVSSSNSHGEIRTVELNASTDASSRGTPVSPKDAGIFRRGKVKRRVRIGLEQSSSSGSISDCADEADWPPFADEDYIVFCFEEHGRFHVLMEGNSPQIISHKIHDLDQAETSSGCACAYHGKDISPRSCRNGGGSFFKERDDLFMQSDRDQPMEDATCSKTPLKYRLRPMDPSSSSPSDYHQQLRFDLFDKDCTNSQESYRRDSLLQKEMGDDEESPYTSAESDEGGLAEDDLINEVQEIDVNLEAENQENEEQTEGSERRDSDQSDSSSCSFTFPVLQWQLVGSPVAWPRSQSLHLRKHKSRRICLRCCMFKYKKRLSH